MDIRGQIFGQKRILAYYVDDGTSKGRKTNWLMAEYIIPGSQLPLQDKKLDTWVLCKVYVNHREKNPNGSGYVSANPAINVNNREKNPNDSGDVSANPAIRSSSHSIVYEEAKELTETDNLQQDMAIESGVQMLPNFSKHTTEQVNMTYYPLYDDRGIVMPNYMPLQPVAHTTKYDPLWFNQRYSNSQPPIIFPNPPSSFAGCAEVGPSTSYANASKPISIIPPELSIILPQFSSSELQDMIEILDDNNISSSSVEQTIQCSPSRLNQRFQDSRPLITLPPLSSPFTEYEEVGCSTSYANTVVPISIRPPEFCTTLPQSVDLELSDIEKLFDGSYVPVQSAAQIKKYDPSMLSQRPSNSQPPPPSPFI